MADIPTNTWIANTDYDVVAKGTRLYIAERMWSPDLRRPPYAAGDRINMAMSNVPEVAGTIVAVAPRELTIEIKGGRRFRLQPTPRGYPPPGIQSAIPAEDWIVVEEMAAPS